MQLECGFNVGLLFDEMGSPFLLCFVVFEFQVGSFSLVSGFYVCCRALNFGV